MHKYTKDQIDFLREKYIEHPRSELLKLFNEKFGTNIAITQLVSTLKRHKIYSGRTGRYENGAPNPNKGRKGWIVPGSEKTWFKKGQVAHNAKPVGTERVGSDGYVLVKVKGQGSWREQWKHKHKIVWESVNGPIPEGYVLIFLDGDKTNINLDNLALVTKRESLELIMRKLRFQEKELTRVGLNIAKLSLKIREKTSR